VVWVAGGLSLWQDNGLRCLKANLVSGRVKPIGNWLCRSVEATTSSSIWWIRLIICIWIIVSWVVVSCLRVFTCLIDVSIFGYKIIWNSMINCFLLQLTLFACFLLVCMFCVWFSLLRWSSIYWWKQMRELLVVNRMMEISQHSLSWVGPHLLWILFYGCSPCVSMLLEHLL